MPTLRSNISATRTTHPSTTMVNVVTAEATVVIAGIVEIAVAVGTDIMETATKAAAVVVVVMAAMTTVITSLIHQLLLALVVRPLLDLVPQLTAWQITARSTRNITELTPMPLMVGTKTMSPTTNITKQLPLNSNNSSRLRRALLLLHLPRQLRLLLPLLPAQDLLPHPQAEVLAIARYVSCVRSPIINLLICHLDSSPTWSVVGMPVRFVDEGYFATDIEEILNFDIKK